MKSLFKIILVFVILTTTVSIFLLVKNKEEKREMQCMPMPFCATKSDTANDPDAQKGKQIFNANCAACHKLDAVSTGPALRDIARKYHEHNMNLHNYLHGKREELLLRHPNKSSVGLCTVFPNLTKQDVASLKAYTR